MMNNLYIEARKAVEPKVHEMLRDTMLEVQANKTKLENIVKSDMYSPSELRTQETRIREANAQLIEKMKEELSKTKLSEIQRGKQYDAERGKMPDLEVANMLSVLSISAKTISAQDLNDMYKEGYFNPMLRRGIEAIAIERRFTLDKPASASEVRQKAYIDAVTSFTNQLSPRDINLSIEVISGAHRTTKNEIVD